MYDEVDGVVLIDGIPFENLPEKDPREDDEVLLSYLLGDE